MLQGVVVEMNEDNFKLDEVVVTGQGDELRRSLWFGTDEVDR